MRDLGIGSFPARRAKNAGARTAVVHGDELYTYADVELRTRRLANALRGAGVRRGDRVAYLGFNHPSLLETFFATARLGAVWVVINARLSPTEVEFVLADSGATLVVHGVGHADHAAALARRLDGVRWVSVSAGSVSGPRETTDYETFLASGSDDVVDEPVTWDDDALIMYTSGTTGRPKGVTHTHGSLIFQYFGALLDTDLVRDEVYLAVAPLFHVAGLNTLALPTFLKAGTLVIHPAFRPGDTLAAIVEHKVTALFAVPTMMEQMAADPSFADADLSSLRSVLVGGSPLSDRMLRAWRDKGVPLQQGFGMTETAPGVFLLLPEDAERRSGSAGLEQFWTEARMVLPDGRGVEPGETGEIVVHGPNVMRGYWNRPDATAEVMRHGWYRTGDLGTYDEDGYAWIKDRLKEMYISGGENVYPAEVENALLDVPGVAEAAVVGVPDARWGEVGHAFLVQASSGTTASTDGAELSEASVLAALDGRLARYKLPRRVTFTEALPRTATGKVRKHLIIPTRHPHRGDDNMSVRTPATTVTLADLASLVGTVIGPSEYREVTQQQVNLFADATDDHQWIHTDPEKAKAGPFGGPIAHGYLTLSLLIPLTEEILQVTGVTTKVNYGLDKARFVSPVKVGARVRLVSTVQDVVEVKGGVQITLDSTVEIEGSERPAVAATTLFRFYA